MQPNPEASQASTSKNPSPDALTAQMEAEIASAMAELDQAAAQHAANKAAKPAIRGPRVVQAGREQRKGRVVSVGPTDVFVEFGPKNLGVISRTQYKSEEEIPKVGDEVDAVVDHRDDDGVLVCVRPGAVQKAAWESLESGQVVDAKVTGVNKGGLELEVAGHRAFMPASQVSIERVPDLNVFMGEKLTCMVSRVDRAGRGNIVLSRRDVLEQDRKVNAEKIKATLAEGQTVEGTVRKIMPFGAFVDIGGIDGLVHISDLSYDRVGFGEKAVAKHIQEGQKVKVQVLKLDWENDRISLGLKQVQGDPFATAANTITEGSDVTGRVVRITEFGAFIELAPGVDGLVHISELDHKRVNKVDDVVKTDEILTLRVLKIDPGTRRVSLSLKALKPLPEIQFGSAEGAGEGGGRGGPRGGGRGREAGAPAGAGGGGGGPGGGRGGMGFGGGGRGRGRDRDIPMRSAEEILKETPALRRAREKAHNMKFKGGLG